MNTPRISRNQLNSLLIDMGYSDLLYDQEIDVRLVVRGESVEFIVDSHGMAKPPGDEAAAAYLPGEEKPPVKARVVRGKNKGE